MKKFLMTSMALTCMTLAACDDSQKKTNDTAESAITGETSASTSSDQTAAEQTQEAGLSVTEAYSYATMSGAGSGAIFAKITNDSGKPDFLLSAKVDPSIAGAVEIHQTYEDPQTGATLMRKTSGIDIGAKRNTLLEPRGYHIMLLDLKRVLTPDETFEATLTFRHAGEIIVPVTVRTVGAAESHTDATHHEDRHHGEEAAPDETPSHDHEGHDTDEHVE